MFGILVTGDYDSSCSLYLNRSTFKLPKNLFAEGLFIISIWYLCYLFAFKMYYYCSSSSWSYHLSFCIETLLEKIVMCFKESTENSPTKCVQPFFPRFILQKWQWIHSSQETKAKSDVIKCFFFYNFFSVDSILCITFFISLFRTFFYRKQFSSFRYFSLSSILLEFIIINVATSIHNSHLKLNKPFKV